MLAFFIIVSLTFFFCFFQVITTIEKCEIKSSACWLLTCTMNCDVKFSKKQQKKAQTTDNESQRRDRDNEHVKSYDIKQAKRKEMKWNETKYYKTMFAFSFFALSFAKHCPLLSFAIYSDESNSASPPRVSRFIFRFCCHEKYSNAITSSPCHIRTLIQFNCLFICLFVCIYACRNIIVL